jgi:hypothetical protein
MSNILDLNKYRKEIEKDKKKAAKDSSNVVQPGKEIVKLWNFSQSVDNAIEAAIVQNDLPMEEVAAVLAHRLATLISISERPEKLIPFCAVTMERVYEEKGINLPGAV